jgi:Flp pilus assembly protein TadG
MVELTIASVLLLTLVMGMLEIGVMLNRYMGTSEAARASVRSASLGSMTGVVSQRAIDTLNGLGLLASGGASITMQYRTYDKTAGVWSGWQSLADGSNGYNSAPCSQNLDSQVRVTVTYTYP